MRSCRAESAVPLRPPASHAGEGAPLTGIRRWLKEGWRFLRQVSGDDAYERYLAHMTSAHPAQPVMTRGAYFRSRQEQRWNRISRCC